MKEDGNHSCSKHTYLNTRRKSGFKEDFDVSSSDTARTLFFLRVIGGWITAVGSFIVAIAVTTEFSQMYPPCAPQVPVPCANSKEGALKDVANAAGWQ